MNKQKNKKYPIEYPRYTREENKAIKYTEELIKRIKELHKAWNWYRKIVKILAEEGIKVSQSWVRYNLLSEEEKKVFNKYKMKYAKKMTKEQIKKYNEDRKRRKKEKLKKYYSINKKEYIKDEEVKKRRREYQKEYRKREKVLKRRREYQRYYDKSRRYKNKYSKLIINVLWI